MKEIGADSQNGNGRGENSIGAWFLVSFRSMSVIEILQHLSIEEAGPDAFSRFGKPCNVGHSA